ncbi:T9SS type A sorting domain-containing protein [Flavobacterium sp.]|uniref:T9SS type A sorting domain-containing protein n=1 Tax=Flavobacterium sp. TaxID=239 RepID=UPI0039E682A1
MQKKLLYLVLFLSFNLLQAQSIIWVNTPPVTVTNLIPNGYLSATDVDGAVYFAGYQDNPYAYTELFGNLLYQKFAPGGNLLFSKTITERAVVHQLQSDAQSNMYMAVEHLNTLTFDETIIPNATGLPQHVLFKISPSGELIWHKVLSMPIVNVNTFKSIAFDAAQNVYLGYDNYGTCYIEKVSPDGDSLQLIVQENVNRLTSLALDTDGNIYAAGSCANTNSTYAGNLQPTNLAYTVYLVKYSAAGVFQWIKYVEDITCPSPMVQVDANNNIYWAAETFISVQLDNITMEGPISGVDFFLAKLNINGDYLWAREVPGNGSLEVAHHNFLQVDVVGNVCLSGTLSGGTTQWTDLITTHTGTFSNREVLVLRYTEAGQLLMAFTGGGNQPDFAHGISTDTNGDIYVTGMMRGNAQLGWFTFSPPGSNDYTPFIARLSPFTFSLPEEQLSPIRVYPNPVTDWLFVDSTIPFIESQLFTLNGQQLVVPQAENRFDFSGLAKGIYVLALTTTNGKHYFKIVH